MSFEFREPFSAAYRGASSRSTNRRTPSAPTGVSRNVTAPTSLATVFASFADAEGDGGAGASAAHAKRRCACRRCSRRLAAFAAAPATPEWEARRSLAVTHRARVARSHARFVVAAEDAAAISSPPSPPPSPRRSARAKAAAAFEASAAAASPASGSGASAGAPRHADATAAYAAATRAATASTSAASTSGSAARGTVAGAASAGTSASASVSERIASLPSRDPPRFNTVFPTEPEPESASPESAASRESVEGDAGAPAPGSAFEGAGRPETIASNRAASSASALRDPSTRANEPSTSAVFKTAGAGRRSGEKADASGRTPEESAVRG